MSAAAGSGGGKGGDGGNGGDEKTRWKGVMCMHLDFDVVDEEDEVLKKLSRIHPNPTLIKHARDPSKSFEKLKEPLMSKSRRVVDVVSFSPHPSNIITQPHELLQPQHQDKDDDDDDHHHKKKKQKIKNEGESSKNQQQDGN